MTTVYSIQHTDPNVPSFIINSAQIDGFGGPKSNSSLILHGAGRLKYGAAINGNFLQLLENFASPARVMPLVLSIQSADNSGGPGLDFITIFDDKTNNFVNGFDFQIVGSTSTINDNNYQVLSSSYDQPSNLTTIILQNILPSDAAAYLGNVSYSVVEPDPLMVLPPYNSGQLWFNKTEGMMYVYKDVSGTGIFRWDYAGKMGTPIAYVEKAGDTITGTLHTLGSETLGSGDANVAGQGNFSMFIDTTSDINTGGLLIESGDIDNSEHAIEVLNDTGQQKYSLKASTGDLTIYGTTRYQAGARLFLNQHPIDAFEAAHKGYVDSEVSILQQLIIGIGSGTLVHTNPTTPITGDLRVTGTGVGLEVFVRADSAWKKIVLVP